MNRDQVSVSLNSTGQSYSASGEQEMERKDQGAVLHASWEQVSPASITPASTVQTSEDDVTRPLLSKKIAARREGRYFHPPPLTLGINPTP